MESEVVYKNQWIKVLKTPKDFYYLERKGKDSVAVFLVRMNASIGWEVLIRYQPLTIQNDDDSLFACPVTGSIDYNEAPSKTASREVAEETGYEVNITEGDCLVKFIVGTQTNEIVSIYWKNVTGEGITQIRKNDSYHESVSKNIWEPLDNLRNYNYSACQIGYYKLKEILK